MTIKILDTSYAHQGHQYEFFKLPCDFTLCQSSYPNRTPQWGKEGRPLRSNVNITDLRRAIRGHKYDVIIHRVNSRPYFYKDALNSKPKVIAVVQTTTPYKIPEHVTDVVWNSVTSMNKFSKNLNPRLKHHYIPHGFDPEEFRPINEIVRNKDAMIIACDFLERHAYMGYDLWHKMKEDLTDFKFDVWGHQRVIEKKKYEDIFSKSAAQCGIPKDSVDRKIRSSVSLENLIETYNSYKVYFNTTSNSAMPRGRGEAMMCGTPIVTTDNFDISNYLTNGTDCILSNNFEVLRKGILDIINDESVREYYSKAARLAAIKNFHIDDYIKKWMQVIES